MITTKKELYEKLQPIADKILDGLNLYDACTVIYNDPLYFDKTVYENGEEIKGREIIEEMIWAQEFDIDVISIIEYLQGSCQSLDAAVETFYPGHKASSLSDDDLDAIDAEIFFCPHCGWWCEVCEYGDYDIAKEFGYENICEGCVESIEDDRND